MKREDQSKKQQNPREIEAALIIYHENPDRYVAEFAALTSIGRFQLVAEDTQIINDIYFDTPAEELEKQEMALRLRKVDDTQLITLKGDSKLTDWGGHDRLEFELIWSDNALVTILNELKKRKIQLSPLDRELDFSNSIQVMEKYGLRIIQQRKNQRRIRNIVHQQKNIASVLAELAIDSVSYQFKDRTVQLHELEIELKSGVSTTVVEEVIQVLLKNYESILRKWDHNKLVTGKAIEKLLDGGILQELLDDFNNLKPIGYDKIDSYIKSGII